MKPLAKTELHVRREGFRLPRPSPAESTAGALVGFAGAVRNDDVREVSVVENRKRGLPSGKIVNIPQPLITFTRTGPQEFASRGRAWWEQRSPGEQPAKPKTQGTR